MEQGREDRRGDETEGLDETEPERIRRGALPLVGGWSDVEDAVIDEIVADIYEARTRDPGRPVDFGL